MNPQQNTDRVRWGLWLPGLLVALGAAVATAHGLYQVARAAHTPAVIAGLYPLITDGLALVAYAATARLSGGGRRYAWMVVVLAAGLSGLAQASYLAHGAVSTSTVLRFGIGAWPAIAAAIVAHLLFLIVNADQTDAATAAAVPVAEPAAGPGERSPEPRTIPAPPPARADGRTAAEDLPDARPEPVQPDASAGGAVQPQVSNQAPSAPVQSQVSSVAASSVQPTEPVQRASTTTQPASKPARAVSPPDGQAPPRVRAERTARTHHARHGDWPSSRELAEAADVSRGTAAAALKALRSAPTGLHIVPAQTSSEAQQ